MTDPRLSSQKTPKPVDAGLSVGGVRVTDMNRDTLRKYVRDMRLKPRGPLKADLKQCLCEYLRRGTCDDEIEKGGDSGPHEDAEGGSANDRHAKSGDGAGDGKDKAAAEVKLRGDS